MCAEVIKKAAKKCRWCQSEIEPEAGESSLVEAETADKVEESVPPSREAVDSDRVQRSPVPPVRESSADTRTGWGTRVLAALLAVACVIAAAVLFRMVSNDSGDQGKPQGNSLLSKGAVVADDSAKRGALSAAAEATQKVLSYSYESLDADMKAAQAVLAGGMLKQYDETMSTIEPQTEKNQAVVVATVVSSSIISVTDTDAKALLFVNQQTTGKHLEQPRVDLNRVVVTMQRDNGDWKVIKLDAL